MQDLMVPQLKRVEVFKLSRCWLPQVAIEATD
jgi:hypothetical protein